MVTLIVNLYIQQEGTVKSFSMYMMCCLYNVQYNVLSLLRVIVISLNRSTQSFSLLQGLAVYQGKRLESAKTCQKLAQSLFICLPSAPSTACQSYGLSSYRSRSLTHKLNPRPPGHSGKHLREASRREKLMARCSVCWKNFQPTSEYKHGRNVN